MDRYSSAVQPHGPRAMPAPSRRRVLLSNSVRELCAIAFWLLMFIGPMELHFAGAQDAKELPGTAPLAIEGELAEATVAGVDRFLLREIDASVESRAALWRRDTSSAAAYVTSVEPNREHFARI